MPNHDRHQELGAFLRTRRESLAPERVGLPLRRSRRLAKGLRREEVAELAEISVTWYTWLEQGRPIRPSTQVLACLADALQLTPAQRTYLFSLALPEHGLSLCEAKTTGVSPRLQAVLDSQGVNPAYLLNPQLDIVAANTIARLVFPDHLAFPAKQRNILWLLFTNSATRQLIVDWEANARNVLALFRANWGQTLDDLRFAELIQALKQASPEFRAWWPKHEAGREPVQYKELNHPIVGRLVLEQIPFQAEDAPALTFLLYTPKAGTETEAKLHQLAALHTSTSGSANG